jgi:hypothetical protein
MTAPNKATPAKAPKLTIVKNWRDQLFSLAEKGCDVHVFNRLADILEQEANAKKEQSWHDAMRACQSEMEHISKDASNPQTRSKYASLGALDSALRPIYVKHGFDVTFATGAVHGEEVVRVELIVTHSGGWQTRTDIDMPCDGKGSGGKQMMTRTHATGSAVTYGRRYLLTMAFNIATVDDDGNAATARPAAAPVEATYAKVSDAQADKIIAIADEVKANKRLLCAYLSTLWKVSVKSIADIPAAKYAEVVEQLALKKQANEDAAKQ